MNGTSVVAVVFQEDAPREAADRVLQVLGATRSQWRWQDRSLMTVHIERAPTAEQSGEIGSVPGVTCVKSLTRLVEGLKPVTLPNGAVIGAGKPAVIAGPCSVENEKQVLEIARIVKDAGAAALRGGVFKPRSSPYSFGGLEEEGLRYLARAREATGLPVVTEALGVEHVDRVARMADVIQIGSRNMQHFPLLFRAGANAQGRPVLLKRGFGCTVDELLQAAEYVQLGRLSAGRDLGGLILCERGIRTFEPSMRFTLDVGAIALIKDQGWAPIIADPSHAAGARRYVRPLALSALAAGADGLLVEVHRDPERAWSDGRQTLDADGFERLMEAVGGRSSGRGRDSLKV
jgi:3-deoxy-7-phosphoheptulonate synthase